MRGSNPTGEGELADVIRCERKCGRLRADAGEANNFLFFG